MVAILSRHIGDSSRSWVHLAPSGRCHACRQCGTGWCAHPPGSVWEIPMGEVISHTSGC